MKFLLISLLLVISSFAANVTFEPTEMRSYGDNPTNGTSIYVTVICVDGYKFIVTNSGSSAIALLQAFNTVSTTNVQQPSKCSQDSK